MKPFQILLISLSTSLITGCSKSTGGAQEERRYEFEVLEYKTNLPIAAAKIDLFACIQYDAVFGCRSTGIVSSKLTDANGHCSFTATEYNKADKGIRVSKAGYWSQGGGSGKNYLVPEASLSLHIVRDNNYPDTSYMSVSINGPFGISFLSFKAPADSIITIKAFGNENNDTKWSVFTRSPECFMFCTADTLARGNFSKPIGKMETGSFTLRY
jgi:hypothetical protein